MSLDILTDGEKSQAMSALAKLARVSLSGYEEQKAVELVDDSIALAKLRVAAGEWSVELARLHVGGAVDAAAVSYAAARRIKRKKIYEAISNVLGVFSSIINARVGFDLLPDQQG